MNLSPRPSAIATSALFGAREQLRDHVLEVGTDVRPHRIEAVLGEATGTVPADPTWPQRLLDVLGLLREHILKEQDGVFPAALAALSAAEWEAVEAVRERVGTALPGPVR
ncbi:hypothetical protein [Streptomyces kaniharaensis]|uniref:hypothetical protein n=1 Tax=Streptomyces kaniharaensis TaxID=212423 RepID=UPI001E3FCD6B|nr:hypothetical protein [Streptomyces kaniharaensis]